MLMRDYLSQMSEPMPTWLSSFKPVDKFDYRAFFSSRIAFYPGAGTDGHLVKLLGSSHCAHCFVYADYGASEGFIKAELDNPHHGFFGYHSLARVELSKGDLGSENVAYHATLDEMHRATRASSAFASIKPYGFLEILERDANLDDTHGAARLAILFLGADGVATYDALFCQTKSSSHPYLVLLQDHGFGGNYTEFGKDGLLEKIAERTKIFPEFLLVAENTHAWPGYSMVKRVEGEAGGMHNMMRFLYKRLR